MTAKSVARELGLTGWVRNEHDRSVLMEIQGDSNLIHDCLGRIQRQTFGKVLSRDESILPVDDIETGFHIRR